MSSEQELLASAAAHARKTSWSWGKWLATIQADPTYQFQNTEWYRAGADLEAVKAIPPTPSPNYLALAQARIFLAEEPLQCLAAPGWMVPVCTADWAYRTFYSPGAIRQLRDRFHRVEAWCDCRNPTAYAEAREMSLALGLDGAWGQCETTAEFDHAVASGATRLVGKIDASVLDSRRLELVSSAKVIVSVELYRNLQPNLQPDWRNANGGVGGNCIACYESKREGAVYTPVSSYIASGLYVPGRDSVYGVGLTAKDWRDLAG